MRYVVGYSANARGYDAVNLAVALARGHNASIDLVLVLPEGSPFSGIYPPQAGYDEILDQQAAEWLDEGLAMIPDDVQARAHIRRGDSEASVLIDAVADLGADLLVIGATSSGLFRRFTVGSVAGALLHSAAVPVALAPQGYHRTDPITRYSCGIGTRPGAQNLLTFAVALSAVKETPLRLVSLLTLDGENEEDAVNAATVRAADAMAATVPGVHAPIPEIVVARGRTIEESVDRLDWEDGEVLLIGSSRLAQNRSIFLGSTANRILRSLPVPMIVVPRDYVPEGTSQTSANDPSGEAGQS